MAKKKLARAQNAVNGQDAKKTVAGKQAEAAVALKINRIFPTGQVGVSANHFVVQSDGPEFHLLFFQAHLPIILEGTEEQKSQEIELLKQNGVPAMCLARIIVAAERMPAFIDALKTNFTHYQTLREPQRGAAK
jgi:hypothetical protein